jgi:hypothetical protein
MFLFKKIKASALQMVLVVAVIIVILLIAFISLMYLQKRMSIKHSNYTESIYTNGQVFQYLKSTEIPFGSIDSISVFSNSYISNIKKKQWGVFERVTIQTNVNKETFEQSALLGASNKKRKALYLRNNNRQLILVGNTTITGNVVIPSVGVNSGNIAGVSYNKKEFIYGAIEQSESNIPTVLNKQQIDTFLSSYAKDTVAQFDLKDDQIKHNSFKEKTLLYQRNGVIHITNSNLTGNIIIESDTLIRVDASTKLKEVILIAPSIEIQSNFKGSFQAFATKNILVKENCQLDYPTSLVLLDTNSNGQIHVSKSASVKGVITYFNSTEKTNYNSHILLDDTSLVFGDVYCQGNLELRGVVNGSVYTNSFIAKQLGRIYINHIYNGTINSKKLPKQFSGLSFNNSLKSIAKWVD